MLETDGELALATMVDMAFPLAGRSLPRDHRQALAQALEAAAPWLRGAAGSGLHPVHVVHGAGEPAWLSARTRLLVRLPRERTTELAQLQGQVLQVGGHTVTLGVPQVRELLPHGTLYAHFVAAEREDETEFLGTVAAELDRLDAPCHRVCGRLQHIQITPPNGQTGAPLLAGFSLMLHGLKQAAALRVLEAGIGPHRHLGCGIFVPHRSAAAVGQ